MRRLLLSPGWLARHALMIACVVAFCWLGWWQWGRGESAQGTLRNLFYGLQWWVFAAFVVFGWARMLRDELRPPPARAPGDATNRTAGPGDLGADDAGSVSYLPPQQPDEPGEGDEELAAYNRYLAWLNDRAQGRAR